MVSGKGQFDPYELCEPMLTLSQIRHGAGTTTFQRGQHYFRCGRVLDWEFEEGLLRGIVQGSRRTPYKVRLNLSSAEGISGLCTCPYNWGPLCKHAVALALTYLEEFSPTPTPSPTVLSGPSPVDRYFSNRQPPKLIVEINTKNLSLDTLGAIYIRVRFSFHHKGQSTPLNLYAYSQDWQGYVDDDGIPSLDQWAYPDQQILRFVGTLAQSQAESRETLRLNLFGLNLLLNLLHEEVELWDWKQKNRLTLHKTPWGAKVSLAYDSQIRRVSLTLLEEGANLKDRFFPIDGQPIWLWDQKQKQFSPLKARADEWASRLFGGEFLYFEEHHIPYLITDVIPSLSQWAEVILDKFPIEIENAIVKGKPSIQVHLDYHRNEVRATLTFRYGDEEITTDKISNHSQPLDEFIPLEGKPFQWLRRDLEAENRTREILFGWGFQTRSSSGFILRGEEAIYRFLTQQLPSRPGEWEVFYSKSFEGIRPSSTLEPILETSLGEDINWFELNISYQAKELEVQFSHEEIHRQLLRGKPYIRLSQGQFIPILQEQFQKMDHLLQEVQAPNKKVGLFHLPLLVESAREEKILLRLEESLKAIDEELRNFKGMREVLIPPQLQGILRNYQYEGVKWLDFLKRFHFGGILADEMGLGKTLQALVWILKEKQTSGGLPCLVVCPTTLVWNWKKEVEKFTPSLQTLILEGKGRHGLFSEIEKADLVITSYPLLRRDVGHYQRYRFAAIFLDEAQHIKNRHTHNAKAAKSLKANHHFVLTGTPIENSIAELWSLFDFVMSGFLGPYEKFKQRYQDPILKRQDSIVQRRLVQKIHPFVLRRLKEKVLTELPPKIEQTSYCQLTLPQMECYRQMLGLCQRKVVQAVQKSGFQKNHIIILTALLRLRQICCHPELAGVQFANRFQVSGKLSLLGELLEQAMDGNHRVLLFSQFVKMLDILAQWLQQKKISYLVLHGKTQNRQEVIEQFQRDPQIPVFLLSLKVGGFGLNLTSADTVILFDPWWNPAVENQAIDRVHRIGQQKSITTYRLITQGTIEEKIQLLQTRKRQLFDSLIRAEEGILKKLDWEDIRFLLEL